MFRRERNRSAGETDASLRALGDLTREMPLVIDRGGWIVRAGQSWERLLGHPPDELAGRALEFLVPVDDVAGLEASLRRARDGAPEPVHFECRFADHEGRHVLLEWDAVADDEGLVHAVARDARERQLARDEADRARQQAEQAKNAEGAFLSRMSHELRTPLTSVIGFSELLMRDELTGEQELKVTQVLKAARHLLSLINEVLEVSSVEGGDLSVSPEPVAIRGLLDEALDLVRPLAAGRDIALRADIDRFGDLYVMADARRVRQVVLNLLSNAIKYNRHAGEIEVSGETVDHALRIQVRDRGAGLDEEQLARLFVPFDRLGAEETKIEGAGLGLVLSRRFVELMGGTLSAESVVGEGSVFTLELGLAEPPAASVAEAQDRAPDSEGELTGHTLLLIEDNATNLEMVTELLTGSGARVMTARDGRSGLSAARQALPDLILLDVHLPDFDGQLVVNALSRDIATADIPVIALSADGTRDQRRRLFKNGVADYVTKPFRTEELVETISETLARGSRRAVRA